jgi:hypothetical protein
MEEDNKIPSFSTTVNPQVRGRARPSVELAVRLLETIRASMTNFKPSKSLEFLAALGDTHEDAYTEVNPTPVATVDIVISGGGYKGYYICGAMHVFMRELAMKNISLGRVAGASAGAWAGFFALIGLSTKYWLETYHVNQEMSQHYGGVHIHTCYEAMWHKWLSGVVPRNAYEICSGRLFVSYSVITPFGLRNKIISEYTSNDDLFNALCASSTIPFLTGANLSLIFIDLYRFSSRFVNPDS